MTKLKETVTDLNQDLLRAQGFKLFQVYDETDYVYSCLLYTSDAADE